MTGPGGRCAPGWGATSTSSSPTCRGRRLAPPVGLRVGPVVANSRDDDAAAVVAADRRNPAMEVSRSAQATQTDQRAADRRIERLRGASMGAAVILVIQFGLGVGVNLYVTLPTAGSGVPGVRAARSPRARRALP